jgi:hypothetical protein
MTFPVVWLMPDVPRAHNDSRHRLTWAQADVERILTDAGGQHLVGFDELGSGATGACVVVPAEYYTDRAQVDALNVQLNNLDWAVVFITSDEASRFPVGRLEHRLDRMRVWVQTPRPSLHHGDRYLPFGLPPGTSEVFAELDPTSERKYDWSFSGQVNHERRRQLVDAVKNLPNGYELLSGGFTQGLPRREFLELLAQTKVVPCPAGPSTPDSFRLWEALEAGCVPIVDGYCPAYLDNYWMHLCGGRPPLTVLGDWGAFPQLLPGVLAGWLPTANGLGAWWQQYRRQIARRVVSDITDVSGQQVDTRQITVLIPTSSIPAHPDTEMIEETVASVRFHLPDAEILVMADGVHADQEHRRDDYETYQQRLIWLARHHWGNATVYRFDEHAHQANMARRVLDQVDTPIVLYVEHDTPLVTDEPIDWAACAAPILADELDVLRFHYEAIIPEPHWPLMIDKEQTWLAGCPVIRTRQFSARPHLASTQWYRQVIADHFPETCRTFIEDRLHGICQNERFGRNRLAIYAPDVRNIKRSLNLDGRGADAKSECVFS